MLIGRTPRLIDAAVLVSCPCDIARWLRERKQAAVARRACRRSAMRGACRARRASTVIAGGTDTNTFPAQAEDYARTLIRRGVDARFVRVDGGGHGLSTLGAATMQAVEEFAR